MPPENANTPYAANFRNPNAVDFAIWNFYNGDKQNSIFNSEVRLWKRRLVKLPLSAAA